MRNLILSMFLFIGCVPAFGQNSSVEICIEFRVGIGTVDTAYGNNAVRLLEVISHLDEIRNDSTLELVEVSFCGAASPGGRVVAGSNPVTPTVDYQGVKLMT